MALVFPASPTVGQVFENWQWDGVKWIPAPSVSGPFLPLAGGALSGPLTLAAPLPLPGVTDGSNAAPGQVGELLSQSVSAGAILSGSWTTITTLTVPAGSWLIWGAVAFPSAANTIINIYAGIAVNQNNQPPDAQLHAFTSSQGLFSTARLPVGPVVYQQASAVTYYVNVYSSTTPGQTGPTVNAFIWALRIR